MKLRGMVSLFVVSSAAFLFFVSDSRSGSTLVVPPWTHSFGMHKVNENQLRFLSAFKSGSLDAEAVFCTGMKDIHDAGNNNDDNVAIFGINRHDNTIIYSPDIGRVKVFGKEGDGVRFSCPEDLTGDGDGNIFVVDTENNRIVHLEMMNGDLVYKNELKSFDGLELNAPSGIDFSCGMLFIADTGNDRIVVTHPDGKTETIMRPELDGATLDSPVSVCAISDGDDWVYYKDSFVAVVDSSGTRLWKVEMNSGRTRIIRPDNICGSSARFNDLDMDYYSNIYITDRSSCHIYKLDRNLNHIITLGTGMDSGVDLDDVRDISINRRFGQVVVLEKKGLRYFWVGTDLLDLDARRLVYENIGGRCEVDVSFLVTEHSVVDIFLEDMNGDGRLYFARDFLLPGGRFNKRIELTGVDIAVFKNCRPRLVAIAKPTYSSIDYVAVTKKSSDLTPIFR